jgi:hypothetical protein
MLGKDAERIKKRGRKLPVQELSLLVHQHNDLRHLQVGERRPVGQPFIELAGVIAYRPVMEHPHERLEHECFSTMGAFDQEGRPTSCG